MSIFPTTIFWPTDGSAQAQLAATTAADLAQRTDSELHVVTVELVCHLCHHLSCPLRRCAPGKQTPGEEVPSSRLRVPRSRGGPLRRPPA